MYYFTFQNADIKVGRWKLNTDNRSWIIEENGTKRSKCRRNMEFMLTGWCTVADVIPEKAKIGQLLSLPKFFILLHIC